jgi:hypothetical protein
MASALAVFLAVTLALSAGYKLRRWTAFEDALTTYSALSSFSRLHRRALGRAVVALEAVCVALLLEPATTFVGACASTALFIAFYAVLARDGRAVVVNCGCWGNAGTPVPRIGYLLRNGLLIASGLALACLTGADVSQMTHATEHELLLLGVSLPFAILVLEAPTMAAAIAVPMRRKAA